MPVRVRLPQSGVLPHAYVLAELDALGFRAEGLRLWEVLRRLDDRRWEPPGEGLDEVAPDLQGTIGMLHALLDDPSRDAATLEALALGCAHAAVWAEERGAYRTALGYVQAAGELLPENPHFAYDVGRVARKMALYDDAEAWLKWAHFAARRVRRWEVATLAVSGLGNLHRQRGNLPRARRHHELARRMARRHDLRTLEGDALYDLAIMSFDFGDAKLGMDYARQALSAYGAGHGRIYHLANDVAWVWMDTFGDFDNAATVFLELAEHVWEPSARVMLFGNLCRAAAGAGWKDVFEGAWIETWTLLRQQTGQYGHSAGLVQLALGAVSFGDWERAAYAASEAVRIARERNEAQVRLAAEAILEALDGGVINDETIRTIFKDELRQPIGAQPPEAGDLVVELASAMRVRRDGAPESPARAPVRRG